MSITKTTTDVNTLKINYLSEAMYQDALSNNQINENELYMTPSLDITTTILSIFYPVGSYYETSDTTFNPNNAWGGTWILETGGQVHVSSGTGYSVSGATTNVSDGGSKDAIIPYHNHGTAITQPTFTYPNHTHNIKTASPNNTGSFSTDQVQFGKPTGTTYTNNSPFSSSGGGNCTRTTNVAVTVTHAGTDGNLTDANMQPYIVVNRWHRTA